MDQNQEYFSFHSNLESSFLMNHQYFDRKNTAQAGLHLNENVLMKIVFYKPQIYQRSKNEVETDKKIFKLVHKK